MTKLSPSILAADPLRLGQAARMAIEAGCDELHFDVMDGHFVPNLTFGPHILKAMKQELPGIVYDVHLMLDNPADFVDPFCDAGADILPRALTAPLPASASAGCRRARRCGPPRPSNACGPLSDSWTACC